MFAGQPADHTPRPAVERIGGTIPPFGRARHMGPEVRLFGAEEDERAELSRQAILRRQMKRPEYAQMVGQRRRRDGRQCHWTRGLMRGSVERIWLPAP